MALKIEDWAWGSGRSKVWFRHCERGREGAGGSYEVRCPIDRAGAGGGRDGRGIV